MPKDSISPEEKLLRLIKGEKKAPPRPALVEPASVKPLASVKTKPLPHKYLTNFGLKNIMLITGLLAFFYMASAFIYTFVAPKNIVLAKASQKSEKPEVDPPEQREPLESYASNIGKRQIFTAPVAAADEPSVGQAQAAAETLRDIYLVGVVLGDSPQAVIEDRKTQKTFYINKGQFIGGYQVEEIMEGKVVLKLNGQKYELTL